MSDYDASLIQIIPPAETLYALIRQIRARPGFYCDADNLSALYHFISGYTLAYAIDGTGAQEIITFGKFHDYVARRTGFSESTSGWRNMVLSANGHDESKALAMFFLLFDEFTLG